MKRLTLKQRLISALGFVRQYGGLPFPETTVLGRKLLREGLVKTVRVRNTMWGAEMKRTQYRLTEEGEKLLPAPPEAREPRLPRRTFEPTLKKRRKSL